MNLFLTSLLMLLTSCGGGSGSSSSSPSPQPAPVVQISGMAAEGNPLVSTLVEIRGSNGETTSTITDASGKFSANVANLNYPMMVKAVGASAYYSTIYSGSYLNVTPWTTLALASLLGTHPENVFANFSASVLKSPSELNLASFSVVQKFLALSALANIDFFNDQFSAQAGDPYDDLLEALKDDLTSSGKTLTQVANEIIVSNNPSPGCPAGQHKDEVSDSCISSIRACEVNNGTGEQVHMANYWAPCQVVSCDTNYVKTGTQCLPASRACSTLPSNAEAGSETWGGSAWGACQISDCEDNYTLSSNTCVADGAPPVSAGLTISSTNFTHAYMDLRMVDLGVKTLVMSTSMDNNDDRGYLIGSDVKSFTIPNIATSQGNLHSATTIGDDLYFQLTAEQDADKLTLFKTSVANGGVASKISLDSSVAGFHQAGRLSLHAIGTNLYYRARPDHINSFTGSVFKYNTQTQASSKVIADLNTSVVMFENTTLSSGNILMYFNDVSALNRLVVSALDSNDQVIVLQELSKAQYDCGSTDVFSPFYNCAPVFLDGKAMFSFRNKTNDTYKFLVTDGTLAGTSMIDNPFFNGGMTNLVVFQNKLIFAALPLANYFTGAQIYGYSHAEGFHLVKKINNSINEVTINSIIATNSEVYILLLKSTYDFSTGSFIIITTGQMLKTLGSEATTTTAIAELSAEMKSLMVANSFDRGPFIGLKGHLVFSSSNRSTVSDSPVMIKAFKIADQSISTIQSSFNGNIMYYKKDPNQEKIIVTEKNVESIPNNPVARILVIE